VGLIVIFQNNILNYYLCKIKKYPRLITEALILVYASQETSTDPVATLEIVRPTLLSSHLEHSPIKCMIMSLTGTSCALVSALPACL